MFCDNYKAYMLPLWFVANTLFWSINIKLFGFKLGLNVIVLLLVGAVWIVKNASISTFTIKTLTVLMVYLLTSYFVAMAGPCEDKFLKLALTAPALFFMVLVGLEIGWRSCDADWLKLQKIAVWVLVMAFTGFLVEMLLPEYFPNGIPYRAEGKYSGIFLEPSHVAISLFPSIAILLLADGKWIRWSGVLALLILSVFSLSSTLIVLIFCWLSYRLLVQGRQIKYTDLTLGLILGVILVTTLGTPTVERVIDVVAPEVTGVVAQRVPNLSSLVYLQGWQDAWANLLRTNGLGLGFNMMGCTPIPDVSARQTLVTLASITPNTEDGSFLFSKLVSEAGIPGILFFTFIVWWWIRLEKLIKKFGNGAHSQVASITAALMFCFVVTSLLRSTAYFGVGLLLMIVGIAASVKSRNMIKSSLVKNRIIDNPSRGAGK